MPFIFRNRPRAVDGFGGFPRVRIAEFLSGFAERNARAKEWGRKGGQKNSGADLSDRKMGDRKMNSEVSWAKRQVSEQRESFRQRRNNRHIRNGLPIPTLGQQRLAPFVILGEPYCPDGIG